MGETLIQKIMARASGKDSVTPGEIVTCAVDLAMILDSGGPRKIWPRLEQLGVGVYDNEKVIVVADHFVPAADPQSAAILKLTRDFVKKFDIKHFYDMEGICHVLMAENGHLQPGMFCCGGDSHSTMGGAFGCYMAGFGAIEMSGVVVTGDIWSVVPETIKVDWSGAFGEGVAAKDIMLFLARELGMENAFKVVEYGGETIRNMSMMERMVLTNMAAELGAETGLIAPDQITLDAMRAGGTEPAKDALEWRSDDDATFCAEHAFDASTLPPQVAAPHKPSNSAPAEEYEKDQIHVDQAYIGACVGAKLTDLHMVAAVLKGRQVKSGTRLMVAPSSKKIMKEAAADGTLATITEAGGLLLPSGCGACAGLGAGIIAAGEVCISSTNRNFQGRMGSNESSVYLGSPYTVAAAAVAGHIIDPREMLGETPS
ncbi:MAG: 3-isopropylmalate dehydratase large subunit [Rhodospirillaceae bacterium]|jgi:3-isopropylmalate/(R)-2-methylmalate dehydratase large subunit|nr:3-isopropylmalate dehydratase large subunit [Rhodospirillaceae bacterium]MBT5242239.1 3-isopropylmalate dehydratase large subunit [Rhodospirillaceae bacterium]MBT5565967.1 3-isopropylmalate dehydratase large subunit [Rhodospirillaceae bacterium]MBT6088613.1 3-isopropylmalate dehydratase large subunit [Rhodospirillaceae bacterium]MBT7451142.1 3-isopropylmalate dehydratase large subunit [Rhodospirillaceae bacterium]